MNIFERKLYVNAKVMFTFPLVRIMLVAAIADGAGGEITSKLLFFLIK